MADEILMHNPELKLSEHRHPLLKRERALGRLQPEQNEDKFNGRTPADWQLAG